MRVLGLETSSRRGTVALAESGRLVVALEHDGAKHAEHLLPLVDRALAASGFSRTSLDRIAVGIGPGSFTGLRVGISLAQGIALGLGRPAVGVGSLRAMCHAAAAEAHSGGLRERSEARGPGGAAAEHPEGWTEGPIARGLLQPVVALIDARRNELFAAAFDATGAELAAVEAVPRAAIQEWLLARGLGGALLVGEVAAELEELAGWRTFRSPTTDLPHAAPVALLGGELALEASPPEPHYLREADAIRPNLPKSPLSSREPT